MTRQLDTNEKNGYTKPANKDIKISQLNASKRPSSQKEAK